LTDGDDTDSRIGFGTVVDRARTEEVMIYAIGLESRYMGPNGRMVRSRPDRGLRKLADETGGGYFELEKSADLAPTFTKVAQELHSQYVLGFTPTQLDGRVHKLLVKMKRAGLTARARRSYLAVADKTTTGEKLELSADFHDYSGIRPAIHPRLTGPAASP
jgi:Ca-activated chloride channel family protein